MPRVNRGPQLIYQAGKGYKNPAWFVVWYESGRRRERCARTQDRTEAQNFMNQLHANIEFPVPQRASRPSSRLSSPRQHEVEGFIQQTYAGRGVLMEVVTPAGLIDVLTPTKIIEIKHVLAWKAAIGQVLVYGLHYPDRQLAIHLFGRMKGETRATCLSACAHFGIEVIWEEDLRA